MKNKKYPILCKLTSLLLSIIIIFNLVISGNAYAFLNSEATYTCYNHDKGINGFFYVIEDGRKEVIYCYNQNLKQPSSSGLGNYKKYDYFSSEVNTVGTEIKSEIAAILYAGYPNDALGLMKEFNISEDKAREYTQDAIWSLTNGNDHTNSNISRNSYINALYFYAEKENGTYGETGNVIIDKTVVLNQVDGVWKSNILTINGDYTGEISFNNLPENISIYDAKTNSKINSTVKVGDSIYIVYSGTIQGEFLTTLNYEYITKDTVFYKSADSEYQDMIGIRSTLNKENISISAKSENKELPSKVTNTNVIINKVEKGTTNKVIGAVLKLYEGNSENGILIKEWTTTDEPMKIKVEAGKTYTLVEASAPEGYVIAEPITFIANNLNESNSSNINIQGDNKDYLGYRYDSIRYITDGKNKSTVYCINHDLRNPDAQLNPTIPSIDNKNFPHYKHWILSSVNDDILRENQTVNFTREQLAEVLLAGYPTDYYGYQEKYGLTDSQAYSRTQAVLDAVLSGNTELQKTEGLLPEYLALANYYNDLVTAYLNPKAENATAIVDFFEWIDGTGKEGEIYQNLVGITPFENNITIEITMEDAKKEDVLGKLEITKKDSKDGRLLPNAGFKIYDENMQLTKEAYTDNNGVLSVELNAGKYYYQEFDAPEGYLLDSKLHEFEITKDKEVISVEALNTKVISVSVEKVWEDNNSKNRPNEIEVQLYKNGEAYGEVIKLNSGNNWRYEWVDLDSTYEWTVDEVNIPEGYIKNVVNNDTSFKITNTKIVGKLEIIKKDAADGRVLPNAGFRIYDENKNLVAEGYTDNKGIVEFELGYGKYYYQEFDAPEGYVLDEKLVPFEIKANGEIVQSEMTNKKIETNEDNSENSNNENNNIDSGNIDDNSNDELDDSGSSSNSDNQSNILPNTGGVNSSIYLLLGLLISLLGVKLFNVRYKYEK